MAVTAISSPLSAPSMALRQDGMAKRVLYAEDQISSRVVTTAMLQRMGFEVDAVDDGDLAVEKARASRYDVILLDIEMPVMDGVTAARLMRAEIASCRTTPILALSAFLADSTEHSVWRDAFDTAVPKPANSNELQRALVRAMAMHDVEPIAATVAAIDENTQTIWQYMQLKLPAETVNVLAATAGNEMLQLALALAAAREATDYRNYDRIRQALIELCRNFELNEVTNLFVATLNDPAALNVSQVFVAIHEWRKQHGVSSN